MCVFSFDDLSQQYLHVVLVLGEYRRQKCHTTRLKQISRHFSLITIRRHCFSHCRGISPLMNSAENRLSEESLYCRQLHVLFSNVNSSRILTTV